VSAAPAVPGAPEASWRRLSGRVVWVDLVQSLLSLAPGLVAVALVGVELSFASLWPAILVAALGVTGAVADVVRWAFTRYRVTDTEVERVTGVLVRRHRSVRRDRIRSVDTHAKLRHRVAGLRVVTIGAGQQRGAGEAAFFLDALSRTGAMELQDELLDAASRVDEVAATGTAASGKRIGDLEEEVFATVRPWWVVYNMFSVWAYLMAAGLVWGLYWLASSFGIDALGLVSGAADRMALGWVGVTIIGLSAGGAIGAIGMGVNFFTSNWRFELARVRFGERSYLRTRRGLFSTREVSRDESRVRGLSIAEPLLWRWMGMADTNVVTTGLSVWSTDEPTALLPRGPIRVAREVAARVLGDPSPLETPLRRHPSAALRRRLWWATLAAAALASVLAVPVATGTVPSWALYAALGLWPIGLLAAVTAYRALGHATTDDYVVVRSGLMSRSTTALRRDAVSTIAVRQSLLQKRLGLCTVSAMTAAGWGAYEASDVPAVEAVELAAKAAPGLLDEFMAGPGREEVVHAVLA
jgi:putative membrane protein